jgi:hypothetical protein
LDRVNLFSITLPLFLCVLGVADQKLGYALVWIVGYFATIKRKTCVKTISAYLVIFLTQIPTQGMGREVWEFYLLIPFPHGADFGRLLHLRRLQQSYEPWGKNIIHKKVSRVSMGL